jgi:hypothetical protein
MNTKLRCVAGPSCPKVAQLNNLACFNHTNNRHLWDRLKVLTAVRVPVANTRNLVPGPTNLKNDSCQMPLHRQIARVGKPNFLLYFILYLYAFSNKLRCSS